MADRGKEKEVVDGRTHQTLPEPYRPSDAQLSKFISMMPPGFPIPSCEAVDGRTHTESTERNSEAFETRARTHSGSSLSPVKPPQFDPFQLNYNLVLSDNGKIPRGYSNESHIDQFKYTNPGTGSGPSSIPDFGSISQQLTWLKEMPPALPEPHIPSDAQLSKFISLMPLGFPIPSQQYKSMPAPPRSLFPPPAKETMFKPTPPTTCDFPLPPEYYDFDYFSGTKEIHSGFFITPKFAEQRKRREKLRENSIKYMTLLSETESFCAGEWKVSDMDTICSGIRPASCSSKYSLAAAEYAISFLNKDGEEEMKLKRLIRINVQCLRCYIYFLTMEASDNKYYEAVVVASFHSDEKDLKFIRQAKYYPEIPAHLRHLLGPTE